MSDYNSLQNKIDFKAKKHFLMEKGSFHNGKNSIYQEDITILNLYVPNNML